MLQFHVEPILIEIHIVLGFFFFRLAHSDDHSGISRARDGSVTAAVLSGDAEAVNNGGSSLGGFFLSRCDGT